MNKSLVLAAIVAAVALAACGKKEEAPAPAPVVVTPAPAPAPMEAASAPAPLLMHRHLLLLLPLLLPVPRRCCRCRRWRRHRCQRHWPEEVSSSRCMKKAAFGRLFSWAAPARCRPALQASARACRLPASATTISALPAAQGLGQQAPAPAPAGCSAGSGARPPGASGRGGRPRGQSRAAALLDRWPNWPPTRRLRKKRITSRLPAWSLSWLHSSSRASQPCQMVQHMGGGVAEVGQDAQLGGAVGAGQLQGLARVVRHREGRELQAAQVDRHAVAGDAQQAVEIGLADARPRCPWLIHTGMRWRRANWRAQPMWSLCSWVMKMASMSLVGQAGLAPAVPTAAGCPGRSRPAVRKAGEPAGLDQRGIAGAAAAQALESQHLGAGSSADLTSGRRRSPARCAARWPTFRARPGH